MTDINITQATRGEAALIAPMIMEAMNLDCCQWFAGPNHTLQEFQELMTRLVEMDSSQYSYRNTLTAHVGGELAGILIGYDGGQLHQLREAFVSEALRSFGIDYSGMNDETNAGEYYLDSLCVASRFRGHGIATRLLKAGIERGRQLGLPATGLLVDAGNPRAEQLYLRVGFEVVGETSWGSHPMHHLQYIYSHHQQNQTTKEA